MALSSESSANFLNELTPDQFLQPQLQLTAPPSCPKLLHLSELLAEDIFRNNTTYWISYRAVKSFQQGPVKISNLNPESINICDTTYPD